MTGPEWSLKLAWAGSNPGNRRGFSTKWMKERLDTIKFLDVTTSMLPDGIPFPAMPQSAEIMNIIVPDMMQNALTRKHDVVGGRGRRRQARSERPAVRSVRRCRRRWHVRHCGTGLLTARLRAHRTDYALSSLPAARA